MHDPRGRPDVQEKFEDKWQAHVAPKLREEAAVRHREEVETLRSLRAAAVASRGERLAAQSEAISSAMARLGARCREAQSLAALQCRPLSLLEKVRGRWVAWCQQFWLRAPGLMITEEGHRMDKCLFFVYSVRRCAFQIPYTHKVETRCGLVFVIFRLHSFLAEPCISAFLAAEIVHVIIYSHTKEERIVLRNMPHPHNPQFAL